MSTIPSDTELLAFFKALADANRLKIVGLLASQTYTVEQLAAILDLRPSTVSHHLSKLAEAGLVSARAEGYYNIYRLEQEALENVARHLLGHEMLPGVASDIDAEGFNRKVVHDFSLPDGRLKTIPAQRKKLEAVLQHLVLAFETGQRYSEKEVNEILGRFHADTASLRRELIGFKLMARDHGEYWRI